MVGMLEYVLEEVCTFVVIVPPSLPFGPINLFCPTLWVSLLNLETLFDTYNLTRVK